MRYSEPNTKNTQHSNIANIVDLIRKVKNNDTKKILMWIKLEES